MSLPDLVNGTYELGGGLMMLWDCHRLYKDRRVLGVNWQVRAYFLTWGVWNLYYYPALGQWASFSGGAVIVLANLLWVGMALRFMRRPRPKTKRLYCTLGYGAACGPDSQVSCDCNSLKI